MTSLHVRCGSDIRDGLAGAGVVGRAQGAEPAIAPAPASWRDPICLTPFGERLLDGGADWAAANGVARWWGGRFLDGAMDWRWDEAAGAPILGSLGRP